MIRTQIYIPSQMHRAAKKIAKKKDEPLAEVLRRFIAKGIFEESRKIKSKPLTSLTKLKITEGPKDLSSKMDKYLYEE